MHMSTRIAILLPRESRRDLDRLRMSLKVKPRKAARKQARALKHDA